MGSWIEQLVSGLGYAGIALLMLAETVFPPIPSELIMPLAGMQAGQGSLSIVGVVAAGTVGAMAGNIAWYAAARALGVDRLHGLIDRLGRWLTIDWDDVERGRGAFDKGGAAFVCLGRMVPTIRSIVSVPAGLLKMPWPRFLIWSTIGTAGWTAVLAGAGMLLGSRYADVGDYIGPISTGIIVVIVVAYVWRVVRWRRG